MLRQWLKDEEGQALTEYGLLIAVIAVAIVATIVLFRDKLKEVFTNATAKLSS